MRNFHFIAIASFILVAFSGCSKGIPNFDNYLQTFKLQLDEGNKVLDRFAVAERTLLSARIERSARGPRGIQFNPDEAAYYLDNIDPPWTSSLRQSLKALNSYNDALSALGSGAAANVISEKVGELIANLVSVKTAYTNLKADKPSTASANVAKMAKPQSVTANTIISRVIPILSTIGKIAGREEARKKLILAYPHLKKLLLALRSGTKNMARVIKISYEDPTGLKATSAANRKSYKKDLQLLAGWVILIDRTIISLDIAVKAAMSDASPANLAALSEAAVELRILAAQIRSQQNKR